METSKPATRKCAHCKRAVIECRRCGRMVCKHYAGNIVDLGETPEQRRKVTGVPNPIGPFIGTCTMCKIGGRV